MRDILRHANPLWRDQWSTNARLLDRRNRNKMKRRRAGVVHTNRDSSTTSRSGCQRWWWSCNEWKNSVKTAEGALQKSCKKTRRRRHRVGTEMMNRRRKKCEHEKERKKNIMKERKKLRNWDPSWTNEIRGVQIMGDSNVVVNWLNGRWKWTIKNSERKCKRRRKCWTKQTFVQWLTIWIYFSTYTEIGLRKLIVLSMRQGIRELGGTRSRWWKGQNRKLWEHALIEKSANKR